MTFLKVPGAELFYTTFGTGPILLFIPGGGGEGALFHPVAQHLKTAFTVVTYDRRGHSQSILNGDQDYSQRLERDADDVAELIKHVSPTGSVSNNSLPIFVFGTSAGAIVALNFLCRHPNLATKVIIHEPPLLHALPETESREQIDNLHRMYETYRTRGVHAAMGQFLQVHMAPEDAASMMGRDPRANPYRWGNTLYWLDREAVPYPTSEIPWAVLEKDEVKEKLIPGVSDVGGEKPAAKCARSLAERLGLGGQVVTFPGAHLGYFTRPVEFASCLRKCLSISRMN